MSMKMVGGGRGGGRKRTMEGYHFIKYGKLGSLGTVQIVKHKSWWWIEVCKSYVGGHVGNWFD